MEFQRLHEALSAEERLRLNALAAEEEQKTTAIHKLIENTKRDIIGLNELIVSLKKQMGDEDLPLVQVRQTNSLQCCVMFNQRCFSSFFKSRINLITVTVFYVSEFPEFKKKVSNTL